MDRTGLAQGWKWTCVGLFNLLPTRRQAAFVARYIRILPTCHDKLECPYDDCKYPNNLIRRATDEPFTDSLKVNSIASITESDKTRI
jgi:hypothetical protein